MIQLDEKFMLNETVDMQAVVKQLLVLEEQAQHVRTLFVSQNDGKQKATEHPYIAQVDSILSGEPIVRDTRTPVRAIVEYWKLGNHPEEILQKLPHLRLAQIFDALSYYDDHREQIEHYIALNRVPVAD